MNDNSFKKKVLEMVLHCSFLWSIHEDSRAETNLMDWDSNRKEEKVRSVGWRFEWSRQPCFFPFLNASLSLTWSSSWLQRSSKWTGCTTMGRGWLKRARWPNCNFTHLINRPFQHTHLLRWAMNLLRFVQNRHWLFNLQAGAAKGGNHNRYQCQI